MLCKKSWATVFLRDSDPAAGLAGNLPLGRLHSPAGARCLARGAIMLLELAKGPPQRRPLPAPTANSTRRNAGIVERLLSLLPTFRAAPSHPPDSTDRKRFTRSGQQRSTWSQPGSGISNSVVCALCRLTAPPTVAGRTTTGSVLVERWTRPRSSDEAVL